MATMTDGLDFKHAVSYLCSIGTIVLKHTIFEVGI